MNARFENSQEITKISLLSDYELLGSLRLVAEKYNTSHAVISSMMRRFGIVYKSHNHNNLPVNHDFFSKNTLKSCYWAGFIAADGCVFKNQVRLALAEKDIDHLRLFKKDLRIRTQINTVKRWIFDANVLLLPVNSATRSPAFAAVARWRVVGVRYRRADLGGAPGVHPIDDKGGPVPIPTSRR